MVMIKHFNNGCDDFPDLAVIDQVAKFRIDFAFDDDIEFERMSVKSAAFVAVRECRNEMRGFEVKGFAQSDEPLIQSYPN